MAAKRTAEQKSETARFVEDLFKASGYTTWADFARAADVHWASLSDWKTGKSVPDGWNLLSLVKAAIKTQPATTPPSTLYVALDRLVTQLREDEDSLQAHPEEAREAVDALRQVADVTTRFAAALEAALEALPGEERANVR